MKGLKAGLKQAYFYLLKRLAKIVRATYLIKGNDEKAEEVKRFTEVLEINQNFLFGDAVYKTNNKRQTHLRRPANLPKESDCQLLRDYCVQRVAKLTHEFHLIDKTEYVELRDLIVSRLILFNARRGGEPARLTIEEWHEAEQGTWLNSESVEKCHNDEKQLFKDLKLTYQSGKGNNHLVPTLFPVDTVVAMQKLVDPAIRIMAGISPESQYVFPSTRS